RVGAGLVRRQVQVGEEREAGAHPVVLLGDGLLDLEHRVGGAPPLVSVWNNVCAGRHIGVVGELGARARVLLQVDLVAMSGELANTGRGDRDAVLVVLDLAGDADLHGISTFRCWWRSMVDDDAVELRSVPSFYFA